MLHVLTQFISILLKLLKKDKAIQEPQKRIKKTGEQMETTSTQKVYYAMLYKSF